MSPIILNSVYPDDTPDNNPGQRQVPGNNLRQDGCLRHFMNPMDEGWNGDLYPAPTNKTRRFYQAEDGPPIELVGTATPWS